MQKTIVGTSEDLLGEGQVLNYFLEKDTFFTIYSIPFPYYSQQKIPPHSPSPNFECEDIVYKKQPLKRSFSYTHFIKKVR